MNNHDEKSANNTMVGTVMWFSDTKGYGFIECPSLKRNVFVHHQRIETDEKWKTLSIGQIVIFEVSETLKGLMAIHVRQKQIITPKVEVV